jgi:hypothetical protein
MLTLKRVKSIFALQLNDQRDKLEWLQGNGFCNRPDIAPAPQRARRPTGGN